MLLGQDHRLQLCDSIIDGIGCLVRLAQLGSFSGTQVVDDVVQLQEEMTWWMSRTKVPVEET